jgi:hypothetical protein
MTLRHIFVAQFFCVRRHLCTWVEDFLFSCNGITEGVGKTKAVRDIFFRERKIMRTSRKWSL